MFLAGFARFLLLAVGVSVVCTPVASRPAANVVIRAAQLPRGDKEERNEAGVLAGRLPNGRLVDQDGREILLRDLLNNNVVVINFVYTTCAAYCGMQAANFAQLQKLLRGKAATGVILVSITTDPKNDTSARLKEWSEKLGRRPGWFLLTGRPEDVEPVLVALTGDKGGPGLHSAVALVANASSGKWIRTDALAAPDKLAAMIDQVRNAKAPVPIRSDSTGPLRR